MMGGGSQIGQLLTDFLARAETGIEKTLLGELPDGVLVSVPTRRLPDGLALPVDAEPGEVAIDGCLVIGVAAIAIDVLDSKQKRAIGSLSFLEGK